MYKWFLAVLAALGLLAAHPGVESKGAAGKSAPSRDVVPNSGGNGGASDGLPPGGGG